MPHRCLNCSTMIADESDHLLSGCPKCSNDSWELIVKPDESTTEPQREDQSQRSARTEFVDKDDVPQTPSVDMLQADPTELSTVSDVAAVEERLNDQFSGITVAREGRYEINLTKLYRNADNNYVIKVNQQGVYTVKTSNSDAQL